MKHHSCTPTPAYTPLYNADAELAVLGALVLEAESYYQVAHTLSAEMFYDHTHQIIYRTIQGMHRQAVPVDMITLTQELRNTAQLNDSLSPLYIANLTSVLASSAHIGQHALYIKQEHLKREMLRIVQQSMAQILSGNDIADTLSQSIADLNLLEEGATNTDSFRHIKQYASQAIDEAEQRVTNYRNGKTNGIHTGSHSLDKITGGWQNGDLIILAARPAMGKTALALNILEAAATSGNDVALFSLEMKGERLVDRLILQKTGILDWRYKQGSLSDTELAQVADTSSYLYRLPVYIDDHSSQTIARIKAKCRLLKKKNKCKLIIIDYLQLAEGDTESNNREQEVARISREAKKMAKSLDVPVIMLSQLNRSLEARTDKRPQLSDIRESGAIEQDADMVMFIHRPDYYGQKLMHCNDEVPNGIELIIAKYREGATGSVLLQHDGTVRNIKDWL
ncbi:MAG: hypothetical protein RL662_760 [Bacteroidota bacterium]|jgi:replicative DNA helicase